MHSLGRFLALLPLLLLPACSMVTVNSDYDRKVNFASYRTYAWSSQTDTKFLPGPTVQAAIRAAVEQELAAKGFSKTAPERAGLLLSYFVSTEQRTEVREFSDLSYGAPYRAGRGIYRRWSEPPVFYSELDRYKVGELTLDFLDRRQQRLVWRGVGTALAGTPEEDAVTAGEAVRAMLAKFPPPRS